MPLWRSPVSPCRTHAVACSYTRTHRDTRSDGGHRRQRDTERLKETQKGWGAGHTGAPTAYSNQLLGCKPTCQGATESKSARHAACARHAFMCMCSRARPHMHMNATACTGARAGAGAARQLDRARAPTTESANKTRGRQTRHAAATTWGQAMAARKRHWRKRHSRLFHPLLLQPPPHPRRPGRCIRQA